MVKNDEVDARERAEVGRPPRGRKEVGGGQHKHDHRRHEMSSTRPGSERETNRDDRKHGRQRARGLGTCRSNAGRRTREASIAAAAAEAQTAAKPAAKTEAQTETNVSIRPG